MTILNDKLLQGGLDHINNLDGVADYNDAATQTTPIILSANTWTTIPNDGQGIATNLNYMPANVTRLLDTSNGQFLFDELDLGDNVVIRNDFSVTPNTNNAALKLRYLLGAGGAAYILEKTLPRLDAGSGQPYRFSLNTDMIYLGDLNTKNNPVTVQINLSTNGTLVNAGTAFGVNRR